MGAWRGVGLVCSLALGCGGALPGEGLQEDERSQLSASTESRQEEPSPTSAPLRLGTPHLVKDIFPPSVGPPWLTPSPQSLVAFRSRLYFAANFWDGRSELWRSDGTAAGTQPVKQFPAPLGTDGVSDLTPMGSRLFFLANDGVHGSELWISDGTPGGTHLVKDITQGPESSLLTDLTVVGNSLLFFRYVLATETTPEHQELWRSNGTADGTVLVRDMGDDSYLVYSQAIVNDTLFFAFSDAQHGSELWRTNGTAAGTAIVKDILPGPDSSYAFGLRALGRYVYFTATDLDHGTELWRTDGTADGTRIVADMTPGSGDSYVRTLGVVGDRLYFSLSDFSDGSSHLYQVMNVSDGVRLRFVSTLPNPYSDPESSTYIDNFAAVGGKLYLSFAIYGFGPAPRDVQLWVTDGTDAGTQMLHHPLSLSDEFGSTLYGLDDRLLFSGGDNATGLELWVSNGTVNGTRLLQDIAPGGTSSYPYGFTRVDSSVFFVADDEVHGSEVWVLPLH